MDSSKTLTERFLVALFRRGQAPYLPISYLKEQGDKVLSKGETDKLLTMLTEMVKQGSLELKDGEYKLINDPFA
ncbi:hypothetical protein SAMN05660337_0322 [Maridesulfovibrio ferrireducens]|uniref:Uncharacterized protein n=1 Tax=Maridesulfovibrio ferrireducens TaxID=246191 RepID=A0A1G9BJT6_9BACT|nr:hypothetical protein [Maridesulfovibrio ferrireducens]SDK39779.1 hypothetical protein SAMN05660337_0322 [Maridesulfovibrio ferrireducens]